MLHPNVEGMVHIDRNILDKTNYSWFLVPDWPSHGQCLESVQIWFLFNFLEFHTMILVMDSELKFRILFR